MKFFKQNLNAAKAAFLPEDEKSTLYDKLCKEYGMTLDSKWSPFLRACDPVR